MSCADFHLLALVSTETTIASFVERVALYKKHFGKDYSIRVQILFPVCWINDKEAHFKCWRQLQHRLYEEWHREYTLTFSKRAECYKNHTGLHYSVILETRPPRELTLVQTYERAPFEIDPPTAAILYLKGYLFAGGSFSIFREELIRGTATVFGYPICELNQDLQKKDCYCYIVQQLIRGKSPSQIWVELKKQGDPIVLNYLDYLEHPTGMVLYHLLHSTLFEKSLDETYTSEEKLLIAGITAIKFKPNLNVEIDYGYIYRLVTYCP